MFNANISLFAYIIRRPIANNMALKPPFFMKKEVTSSEHKYDEKLFLIYKISPVSQDMPAKRFFLCSLIMNHLVQMLQDVF